MEGRVARKNDRCGLYTRPVTVLCMLILGFACAEDSKGKRKGNATSNADTQPTTIDQKQLCFEQKRQAEVDAGRTPDNIAIYEECGFFKGEFGWRDEYLACKASGKIWDGSAKTCSSIDMDPAPCTYEYIEQKWGAKYVNFAAEIDPIKSAGYEADQCGTTPDHHPYLVFVKYDVNSVAGGGIEEEILYKYVRNK